MNILDQDIMYLPGVGPNRKKMLSKELGIETYGDLLEYYPYKYVDRSKVNAWWLISPMAQASWTWCGLMGANMPNRITR